MRTIALLAGIESLSLHELAELLAYAQHPAEDDNYRKAKAAIQIEVDRDAQSGSLPVHDKLTGARITPAAAPTDPLDRLFWTPSIEILYGVVMVPDVIKYAALRYISVEIESAEPEAAHSPAEPAPVVPAKPGAAQRWTPEFTNEVRAYRASHTEAQTAEKYGVAGSLIRRKLAPSNPASKPKATPFSGLVHRSK